MYVDGQVNRRFEDVTTGMSKYEFHDVVLVAGE